MVGINIAGAKHLLSHVSIILILCTAFQCVAMLAIDLYPCRKSTRIARQLISRAVLVTLLRLVGLVAISMTLRARKIF